jgi:hypothetical protein
MMAIFSEFIEEIVEVFMDDFGIVLGHVISERGIKVDKAKVEIVEQLPPPTDVKSLRSFLGHVHRQLAR